MIKKIILFLKDIKFEHSLFALPFAYLGLVLAEGRMPSAHLWIWVTAAMVSFRTLAMALNRLFDASIDARNPRTQGRAIPSGKLSKGSVIAVSFLSLLLFEISAFILGPLCFLLSPVPFVLAAVYPVMKRVSWISHFVLGSVLAIAPYGAWIASRGEFAPAPTFLSLGVICWVAGFDMIYALQDLDFDREEGLHSFPARFGRELTLAATKWLHFLSVFFWALAGFFDGRGWGFFAGILLAAFFLYRSYRLVRSYGVAKINEAFFVMNVVVSVGIFAAAVLDLVFGRGSAG
jgi:4-hydroxybenzoate polyprenyltransferase